MTYLPLALPYLGEPVQVCVLYRGQTVLHVYGQELIESLLGCEDRRDLVPVYFDVSHLCLSAIESLTKNIYIN